VEWPLTVNQQPGSPHHRGIRVRLYQEVTLYNESIHTQELDGATNLRLLLVLHNVRESTCYIMLLEIIIPLGSDL
jgi:hypothetical protein